MERCVQQNLFHTKQLQYRDHLSATTKDAAKLAEDDAKTARAPGVFARERDVDGDVDGEEEERDSTPPSRRIR